MIMITTFIIIFSYNYVLLSTVHKTHVHDLMNLAETHEANKAVIMHIFQVGKLKAKVESFSPDC